MSTRSTDEDDDSLLGSLLPAAWLEWIPTLRLGVAAVLVVTAGALLLVPERLAYVVDGSLFAPPPPSGTVAAAAARSADASSAARGPAAGASTGVPAARSVHADRPATVSGAASAPVTGSGGTDRRAVVSPSAVAAVPPVGRPARAATSSATGASPPATPVPSPAVAVPVTPGTDQSDLQRLLLESSDPMAAVRPETVTSPIAVPLPGQGNSPSVAAPDSSVTPGGWGLPPGSAAPGTPVGSAGAPGSVAATTAPGAVVVNGSGAASQRMYGASRSGLPWHSGFWTGGFGSAAHILAAEQWRGTGMDFVTTYPAYATWDELASDTFAVGTFDGFPGRLSYGLPLLPQDRRGQWGDVISGAHDDVFRGIARLLVSHGRGDSVIRVGLEANGSWFPWGVTAGTAAQYRDAFRRVVTVMRAEAPALTFWFDTAAGSALSGGSERLDALTVLYPGDDVVDGISMDHFDFYDLVARDESAFAAALRPGGGPGLQDAVDFARRHGKGFGVPEWGLHAVQGPGDNPFFIRAMFAFFQANADVLVFENYFNEPDTYIANALFESGGNPQSSAAYLALWGRRSA